MTTPTVVSLCDLSGIFVQPWIHAGYHAVLVDPQHGWTNFGQVTTLAMTVEEALPTLASILRHEDVAFVAAFPPCTDMAVSGARWFAAKRAVDPMFQAKAVAVAEQCRTLGQLSGAPWFVENPVSVLRRVFGSADHTFHPCDYTAYEPADNYTKKTCLWTGKRLSHAAPTPRPGARAARRPHPQGTTEHRPGELPVSYAGRFRAGGVRGERAGEGGSRMTTTLSWECLAADCDEYGTGPDSNREAERHVRRTGHATTTHTRPA